jgi:hypothetical protein
MIRGSQNNGGPTGGNSGPDALHPFGHACAWCLQGISSPASGASPNGH